MAPVACLHHAYPSSVHSLWHNNSFQRTRYARQFFPDDPAHIVFSYLVQRLAPFMFRREGCIVRRVARSMRAFGVVWQSA